MLHVHLLREFKLKHDGAPLKLAAPPRTIALWSYLLLHADAPISRERLAQLLWPDEAEPTARANLRRHLYSLGRALPPASSGCPWLLSSAQQVQWNPSANLWLDVAEFERRADNHQDEAAVALYSGDLLPALYDDWLFYERERLRNLYVASLERLIQTSRRQHDYATAITYARQLLTHDPLHEKGLRWLAAARYEAGDRAGAIAEYERFAELLRGELGVAPMPETVALYEAIVRNATIPSLTAPSSLSDEQRVVERKRPAMLPFVGREREMAWLELAWKRAAQGHGGVTLVSGEAGIGKSRLVGELAHQADADGARVLWGGASEAAAAPYQAIVAALRSALPLLSALEIDPTALEAILPLVPELAQRRSTLRPLPHIDPQRERARLYQGLAACLVGLTEPRPLMLVLEDLHWAGQATIEFLRFLSDYITNQPLLVIATYREEEAAHGHPLRELQRGLAQRAGDRHVALGRLGATEVTALVGNIPALAAINDLASRLYQQSEGHPFFLSELIGNRLDASAVGGEDEATLEVTAGLPERVHRFIAARTARLKPNTQLLAEIASVAGTAFNIELVREVAGWSDEQALDALDELLDQRLVRDAGRRGVDYAFSHHLIQETIYAAIDTAVRQRRHRRTALVLEELYPERLDELAAELARHFDRAADPAHAVPYYLRAARRALTMYADDEAIAAIIQALALSAEPQARFEALALGESIHMRRGEREAQRADLDVMAALADELADEELICETLCRQIALQSALDQREQQAQLVEQLASRAAALGSQRWQAAAWQARAMSQYQLGQYDATQINLALALGLYRQLDDNAAQVQCYCLLAECAISQGQFSEASAVLARASALAAPDNQLLLLRILNSAVARAGMNNEYATAYQLAQQRLDISQAIQDRGSEAKAHDQLALAAMFLDSYAEAAHHFEQARAIFVALGERVSEATVLGNMGIMAAEIGSLRQALDYFRQAEAAHRGLNNPRGQVLNTMNSADIANELNDYRTAKAAAQRGLALARAMKSVNYEARLLAALGYAEVRLGELRAAISNLETAALLGRSSLPGGTLVMPLCDLACAYLYAGNTDAAQQITVEAITLYQNQPHQVSNTHYLFWLMACVQHRLGDTQSSERYLAQAYVIYEQRITERELKLGSVADDDWHSTVRNIPFNRELLAAKEQGKWPTYATAGSDPLSESQSCTHCHSQLTIKAGLNPSGSQRYQCQSCQRYFTAARKSNPYAATMREQAMQLHREGQSLSAIARILGVNRQSVSNWLKASAEC